MVVMPGDEQVIRRPRAGAARGFEFLPDRDIPAAGGSDARFRPNTVRRSQLDGEPAERNETGEGRWFHAAMLSRRT
jgi:hypothetical protein